MARGVKYGKFTCHILHPHAFSVGCKIWRYTGLRDWGPVDGTQTGTFDLSFYYYYQNSKKKQTYLPVSAVIPPPDGWIQHSVPHGKLL